VFEGVLIPFNITFDEIIVFLSFQDIEVDHMFETTECTHNLKDHKQYV